MLVTICECKLAGDFCTSSWPVADLWSECLPYWSLLNLPTPCFLGNVPSCLNVASKTVFNRLSRLRRVVACAFGKLKFLLCFLLMGLWWERKKKSQDFLCKSCRTLRVCRNDVERCMKRTARLCQLADNVIISCTMCTKHFIKLRWPLLDLVFHNILSSVLWSRCLFI